MLTVWVWRWKAEKPGWYDALNGMPGMFGSSMVETYELARMLEYTIGALKRYPGELELIEEFSDFLQQLDLINASEKEPVGYCKKQGCTTAEEVKKRAKSSPSGIRSTMQKRLTVRKYSPEYPGGSILFPQRKW